MAALLPHGLFMTSFLDASAGDAFAKRHPGLSATSVGSVSVPG